MMDVLARRRAGVLLHPTSLPGPGVCGTLGIEAYRFVDFLHDGGFSVWQTLPLGPVDRHGSPYCLRSTQAGDTRLIDPGELRHRDELPSGFAFDIVLDSPTEAYRSLMSSATPAQRTRFAMFLRRHRSWLLPYGLFAVCTQRFHGTPWWEWPEEYRNPRASTLMRGWKTVQDDFRGIVLLQYLFDLQWSALKRYANARGVHLFGDMPFYVDLNSVEVWRHRELFRLDEDGMPEAVAGVPPDYFSANGQRWGNPLYDWERMQSQGFRWWVARVMGQLRRFDLLRIDHFRALESYWEIPAAAATAREGRWRPGYGDALLGRLRQRLGDLPLVAEDLGMITESVHELRKRFELPGMAVLQFAFDGKPENPHLPENHVPQSVVYTGTHDNDTTLGWFDALDASTRLLVRERLGVPAIDMPETLIEAAYASRAQLAIVPMQDLLALDGQARMNTPGTSEGNWHWRFSWSAVPPRLTQHCRDRAERHARLP